MKEKERVERTRVKKIMATQKKRRRRKEERSEMWIFAIAVCCAVLILLYVLRLFQVVFALLHCVWEFICSIVTARAAFSSCISCTVRVVYSCGSVADTAATAISAAWFCAASALHFPLLPSLLLLFVSRCFRSLPARDAAGPERNTERNGREGQPTPHVRGKDTRRKEERVRKEGVEKEKKRRRKERQKKRKRNKKKQTTMSMEKETMQLIPSQWNFVSVPPLPSLPSLGNAVC